MKRMTGEVNNLTPEERKALLKHIGVIACDAVRLPQTGLNEEEKKELFAFFEEKYTAYDYRR